MTKTDETIPGTISGPGNSEALGNEPPTATENSTGETGGVESPTDKPTKRARKTKTADEGSLPVEAEEKEALTTPAAESPAEAGAKEEEKSELAVSFTVTVSKEKVEEEFTRALTNYAAEIKLPGFRQGKVPIEVLRSRYKEAIRGEVVEKVLQEAISEKIEADKMKVISHPHVTKMDFEEGKDLQAEVEVEVFPEIELPYLETLDVAIPAAELKVEEYDENKQIDLVLEARRRQVPATREIREGDYVMLSYQSQVLPTKRLTPRKDTYYLVKEAESDEIPGLYKEIMGKKNGDSLTVKSSYPADYPKKTWAGKEVEHYITVKNVSEFVKPQLDKELLKSMGFEDEQGFKNKLKEEYAQMTNQRREDKKLKHIMDRLYETVSFPVPKALLEEEISHMIEHKHFHPEEVADENKLKEYLGSLKDEAEKSVRLSFIIEAIKDKFNLEVGSDELEKHYKNVAEKHQMPVKEVRKFYSNKENAQSLKNSMLREKVMDLIKNKVNVKEV